MKALRKQFAAAIAMTLVAAIALGSSTYAWFATNNSAEANGMKVTASTTGGLLIGAYKYAVGSTDLEAPASYLSAVPAAMNTSGSLYPTSTAPFASKSETGQKKPFANSWFWAVSDSMTDGMSKVTQWKEMKLDDDGEVILKQYRLYNRFNLQTVEGTAKDVYLKSVTVKNRATITQTDTFDKSLRVAVEIDGTLYTYAPYSDDGTMKYVYSTTQAKEYGAKDYLYKDTDNKKNEGPKFPVLHDVKNSYDAKKDVSVYIYYEGMDPNCYSYMAIYGQNTKGTARTLNYLDVAVELTTTEPNLW